MNCWKKPARKSRHSVLRCAKQKRSSRIRKRPCIAGPFCLAGHCCFILAMLFAKSFSVICVFRRPRNTTLVTARREALWQSGPLLLPHPRHCEARSAVAVQTLLKLQSALFLTGLPRALRSLAKTRNRSCCFTGLPHSLRSLAKTRLEAWGSNFITARLLARAQSHLNMHPLLARKGNAQKGAP